MEKEQLRAAKAKLVVQMQKGYSWQEAAVTAGIRINQSTAYRLCRAVRERGEAALQDGRHGHPSKLRGAARSYLEEQCRQTSHLPSSALQMGLRERFGLQVSVSQINRVRATLGISNSAQAREPGKKQCKRIASV